MIVIVEKFEFKGDDFRNVIFVIKIVMDLECIGDLLKNIVKCLFVFLS